MAAATTLNGCNRHDDPALHMDRMHVRALLNGIGLLVGDHTLQSTEFMHSLSGLMCSGAEILSNNPIHP